LPTGDLIGATASAELLKFMSYTKANNISWTFWEYKRQGSSIIDWQNSKQSPSGSCTSPHTATNLPKQPLLADLLTGIFPTPVVNISAGPNPITAGSATTINWSTTDATSCTASGAWSGSQSTSGSLSTGVLSSNTTYSLDCIGQGGETTASVTVVVNPPGQTFKTGDLNHDGYVNVFDLSILLSHYGGGGSPMQGDINQDSKVDVFDLSTLLTHYGS
jgi:hypothetical protein